MSHLSVKEAIQRAAESKSGRYGVLLNRDDIEIGYYAPKGVDPQSPHTQDEVYVIHAGSGRFQLDGDEFDFQPGDVLFVPAHAEHRFVDFSDDIGAWVVFYGPEGGDAGTRDE